MASGQNFLGVLYSSSIVLAISMSVLFLRSTTPFCCGVYGAENSCVMPKVSRYVSRPVFLNSVPLSLDVLYLGTKIVHSSIGEASEDILHFSLVKDYVHPSISRIIINNDKAIETSSSSKS